MLELESGSNDPCAYMLTVIILGLMSGNGYSNILPMVLKQVIVGVVISVVLAKLSVFLLRHAKFEIEGFYPIFITAIAVLSYSLSEYFSGNGYLSVYITGIIVGNSKIPHKKSIFQFFDGISWIMQIMLFFLLGLIAFPSKIPSVMIKGISISIFMIFVARPVAIFSILYWFKVQGTIIPRMAKRLDLIDNEESVLRTFNDYKEDKSTRLIEFTIDEHNAIANKTIMDANIPEDILVVMIKRDGDVFVPNGSTEILPKDILVLSGNKLKHFNEYKEEKSTTLTEFSIETKSSLINKPIKDANIPDDVLIVMIKRKGEVIVPNGNTVILPEDILVVTSNNMDEIENLLSI